MTFLFWPAAAAVEDAYGWCEGQRIGLGEEFLTGVGATLARIIADRRQYLVIRRASRRALLNRFAYVFSMACFRGRVLVIARMHAKRDPLRWPAR